MPSRVFLAVPHYDTVEFQMARAAMYSASRDRNRFELFIAEEVSSLLAAGFNSLWCKCLNDESYDYWAMLHSDVVPQDWWLDTLIGQLEESGHHAIHAVCAIKDGRGLTSTAVGHFANQWDRHRKLAISELGLLPECFDLRDCMDRLPGWAGSYYDQKGRLDQMCLLPNTGCLVVRIADYRKLWRTFGGFNIRDRISVHRPNGEISFDLSEPGTLVNQVESEDWAFGRWCARHGLSVAGSTAVKTDHWGKAPFTTKVPWGLEQRHEEYFAP